MKLFTLFGLVVCWHFSASAAARVYIEPKLGFGSAGVNYAVGSENGTKTSVGNFNVGSIFGAASGDLYFGLDTRYDSLSDAYQANGSSKSLNYLSIGLGLGYTMTYVPLRWTLTLDLQQRGWSDNFNNSFESGGWRTGLGYYLGEKFLINFEYSEPYYKTTSSGNKFLPRIYSFGISFPMDFSAPTAPWKERRGYATPATQEDDFGAAEAAAAVGDGLAPMPSPSDSINAAPGASNEFDLSDEPQVSSSADSFNDLPPPAPDSSFESTGDPLEDELDF